MNRGRPRQFVILQHDHPFLHWDFMFEDGEGLQTWRLLLEPRPGRQIVAQPLAVHRLEYLSYEGPVSGGRGAVCRVDGGHLCLDEVTTDRLSMTLRGDLLSGRATIYRTDDGSWCFHLSPADGERSQS